MAKPTNFQMKKKIFCSKSHNNSNNIGTGQDDAIVDSKVKQKNSLVIPEHSGNKKVNFNSATKNKKKHKRRKRKMQKLNRVRPP